MHYQDKKEIWCYDLKEAEAYPGGLGIYVGEYLLQRPPTHIVEFDYDACIDEWGKEQGFSGPPAQSNQFSNTPQEFKQSNVSSQPSFLKFLGINPYQTWLRLQETVEVVELYVSGEFGESLERIATNPFGKQTVLQRDEAATKAKEEQFEAAFGKDWRVQLNKINNDMEVNAWKIPVSTGESVVDVPGTADVKRYSWESNSGAVIRSNTWETVTFKEPVVTDDVVTRTVEFREGDMEVKVKNEKPTVNRFAVDASGFFDLFVIQTHFRITSTPEKKLAVISIYEGEVEIKTNDGQTVKLKPDGDKPRVLVVSKKLSPVKLAVAGLALFAITGAVVWLLKRKTSG